MMRIEIKPVTCNECQRAGDVEIVVDCPLELAAASLKAVRCPHCGSSNVRPGGNHENPPAIEAPLAGRVAWWRDHGEHGVSSLTLFVAFTGGAEPHYCWPWDPDDFRRCKQLFDLFPEWRADLSPVVERFPWMQPFMDRWGEFERLYMEEVPTGSGYAPRLYQALKVAAKEAQALREA